MLLPDAEGEVDAALDGGARDHPEGRQVPFALLVGQAGNGDVRELGHRHQEGVGRDQVGGLVPEGEAEGVEAVERELVEVGLPEGSVEVPGAVDGRVVRKDADAALAQERRLAGGREEAGPVQRRRGQVDAAGGFTQGVGETAVVRAADQQRSVSEGESQGFGSVTQGCPSCAEGSHRLIRGRGSKTDRDRSGVVAKGEAALVQRLP